MSPQKPEQRSTLPTGAERGNCLWWMETGKENKEDMEYQQPARWTSEDTGV